MPSLDIKDPSPGQSAPPPVTPSGDQAGVVSLDPEAITSNSYEVQGPIHLARLSNALSDPFFASTAGFDADRFSSFLRGIDEIDIRRFTTEAIATISRHSLPALDPETKRYVSFFLDTLVGHLLKKGCNEVTLSFPILDAQIEMLRPSPQPVGSSDFFGSSRPDLARALYRKGDLMLASKTEDRATAVSYLRKSCDIYRRAKGVDDAEAILPLLPLSHEARLSGDLEEADRVCHQIENLLPNITPGRNGASMVCAAAHYSCGKTRLMRYESALSSDTIAIDDLMLAQTHLSDALNLLTMESDSPLKGRTNLWYGKALFNAGQTYEAIKYIKTAEDIFRKIDDVRYVKRALELGREMSTRLTGEFSDKADGL